MESKESSNEKVKFFEDYFDEYNIDHIEAYLTFCNTGRFPDNFLPKKFSHIHTLFALPKIQFKMSLAFAKAAVKGQVYAMPAYNQ